MRSKPHRLACRAVRRCGGRQARPVLLEGPRAPTRILVALCAAEGGEHAPLVVKRAKAYLDGFLPLGWNEAILRIRRIDLEQWFGNWAQ